MLIGFILFIVGLVQEERPVVYAPAYQYPPPPPQATYQPPANPTGGGFCHNCGAPLTADTKFCPKCGTARL